MVTLIEQNGHRKFYLWQLWWVSICFLSNLKAISILFSEFHALESYSNGPSHVGSFDLVFLGRQVVTGENLSLAGVSLSLII